MSGSPNVVGKLLLDPWLPKVKSSIADNIRLYYDHINQLALGGKNYYGLCGNMEINLLPTTGVDPFIIF